jgi:hypothetical protein
MPHDTREEFSRSQPVHVTLRVLEHVWNLRSERAFVVIRAALARARRRSDFAVVHFSVQAITCTCWSKPTGRPRSPMGCGRSCLPSPAG